MSGRGGVDWQPLAQDYYRNVLPYVTGARNEWIAGAPYLDHAQAWGRAAVDLAALQATRTYQSRTGQKIAAYQRSASSTVRTYQRGYFDQTGRYRQHAAPDGSGFGLSALQGALDVRELVRDPSLSTALASAASLSGAAGDLGLALEHGNPSLARRGLRIADSRGAAKVLRGVGKLRGPLTTGTLFYGAGAALSGPPSAKKNRDLLLSAAWNTPGVWG
ncbi:MAG: hypothetical protein GX624_05455 [Actinobacteria bacterium]|nr:hypothetical protein [Actinomycetota bacterium]